MTKDEFARKFRGRMLLFLTEAWACRKDAPSALGMTLDQHTLSLRGLMDEMYDTLTKVESVQVKPAVNGIPQRQVTPK